MEDSYPSSNYLNRARYLVIIVGLLSLLTRLYIVRSTTIASASSKRRKKTPKMELKCISLITTILVVLLTVYNLKICHSALLTNIYSKNKLSEVTDIAHRYLIIPSPSAVVAKQNLVDKDTSPGSGSILNLEPEQQSNNQQQQQQQQQQQPESLSDDPQLPKPDSLVASPLAAAWKSSSTSSQPHPQLLQKAKLYLQPQNSTNSNSFSQLDFSRVPGEPSIAEGVSTEFPNPNINNLGHEITKILKKFFLHGYDKRVRPNYSGPPALVNVSFHIIGISSVDEVQMDFTTDFYFRQKWYDPRLEFDPVGSIDELCVGAEFAEKIWLPDTFFANEKVAIFHKATTDNTFIRIAHTGRVYRSIRLTVTCSCPMDLQYFPMDRQRCKIEIESYGYNTRDIDYRWERGDASVTMNDKIELPQFRILGFKMGHELQNLSSGDYIRLYCEIHFVRSMGYYLIQIYIPASLIVMISWVSFWLHRNATPARVALGVTTVLTMTTLMSSTNAALPKISYIKSIDVFLGTCFVMVFASLLEYASVGYIGKRIAMKRKRLQDLQQIQQHHQKVCVAAAASAAAAAAASQAAYEGSIIDGNGNGGNSVPITPRFGFMGISDGTQTLRGRLNGNGNGDNKIYESSKSLQRVSRMSTSSAQMSQSGNNQDYNDNFYCPRSAKIMDNGNKRSPNQHNLSPNEAREPLLSQQQAAAMASALQPPVSGHGPTSEFEVSQTHDMVRICGITPSAIDKHSRVVFPICFICFNLMYWIIYGHISQQTEDNGPMLIPFIKS